MDDNKDIEKVSKSVFDDHSMEPPASAWSKLEGDLNKKQAVVFQRKANNFKLLSLVLSLFLCCFVTCHYLVPTTTLPLHSTTQKSTEKNILRSVQIANQHFPINSNPISTETTNPITKIASTTIPTNSSNYKNKSVVANLHPSQKKKSTRKTIDLTTPISDSNIILTNNENANETSNVSTLFESTINAIPTSEENNEINISTDNQFTANSTSISNTESDSISIDTVMQAILVAEVNHAEHPRYSLSLYFAQGISMDYLKDKSNNHFNEVVMYKDREKPEYSFIAGINMQYALNKNWSVGGGISYSSLVKSMQLPFLYSEANGENQFHFMYPTSSGVIELPNDGGHLQAKEGDTLFENSNCRQVIRFLNIPTQIRYQFSKNKFTFYANTGLTANFIIQEKAKIAMQTSEITVTNKVKGLKKVNFGYQLGIGVSFALKKHLDIYLEPTLRGSLSSITKNMAVNSYPHFLGLSTGFTFKF